MGSGPLIVLLVLALIGTFATGFLTYRHIALVTETGSVGESFLCRADGKINCDAVLLTDYAFLFDYVSSAALGLMGSVFVLWCVVGALVNERMRKLSWVFLVLYFFAAIGFSWYFLYVMIYEVNYICTWCLVVHAVNLISIVVVIAVSIKRKREFLLPEIATLGERTYFVVGGVLLSLLVLFVSGMVEKQLGFDRVTAKYEELANDPVVVLAKLKESPSYEIPISDRDPVFGLTSAPYPLIVFSDFACPACAKTEALLRFMVLRNRKILKLVYKSYPLSTDCNRIVLQDLHPMGCQAAVAAHAAFILGGNRAFLNYGGLLFEHQKRLSREPWLEFAEQIKLDPDKFKELLKAGSPAVKEVEADVELGIRLKISSTPQIFFEKKKLTGKLKGPFIIQVLEGLIRMNHPEMKDLKLR